MMISCIIVLVIILLSVIVYMGTENFRTYNKAKKMMDNKQYYEAIDVLNELGDYRDSSEQIYECKYQIAVSHVDEKEYEDALDIFSLLSNRDYKDSSEKKNLCEYEITKQLFENGDYLLASEKFYSLSEKGYADSIELYKEATYKLAEKYIEEKSYEEAVKCLKDLNYKDSDDIINSIENGTFSLNMFIERYNSMVDIINEKQNILLDKLDANNVTDNELKTSTGVTVTFNKASDVYIECKYEVNSFMWYKKGWIFADSERLLADWYCCIAGFMPDSTFETVGEILTDMVDGAGVYGSVTYNDFFYNTSKTKAELTLSGSQNK